MNVSLETDLPSSQARSNPRFRLAAIAATALIGGVTVASLARPVTELLSSDPPAHIVAQIDPHQIPDTEKKVTLEDGRDILVRVTIDNGCKLTAIHFYGFVGGKSKFPAEKAAWKIRDCALGKR